MNTNGTFALHTSNPGGGEPIGAETVCLRGVSDESLFGVRRRPTFIKSLK